MLSKNQLGFLYMFMSICAFSIMDLIVKWSENYALGQVLFFRGFFGLVLYFFIMPRDRIKNFYYTKRSGLHFLRCLFGLIALVAIFIALRNLMYNSVPHLSKINHPIHHKIPVITGLQALDHLSHTPRASWVEDSDPDAVFSSNDRPRVSFFGHTIFRCPKSRKSFQIEDFQVWL